MKVYLVGGAVRDRLLGLPVKECDWVVVGATEEEMLELGYRRVAGDFPVFLHPRTGEEHALARREVKTSPGYRGFEVDAGPDVTLEQDLIRRDLTINALAEDESGELIDLFHGREDLDDGMLRHISPAFAEDPVRLLRVARFAARLGRWGFRVAHGTHALMKKMAASDELPALKRERVWKEMKRALGEEQSWRFFEVLHRCGALERLAPALGSAMGDPEGHKGGDESLPVSLLKRAVDEPDPRVRCALALFPAVQAPSDIQALAEQLRLEREYTELLEQLLEREAGFHVAAAGDPEAILALLVRGKAWQQPERFDRYLRCCALIWPGGAERWLQWLSAARQAAGQVDAGRLKAEGFEGAELGRALERERLRLIVAALPGPGD